ncbi:MAG: helix-turn-helix domain-containing protein [Verrucomicrobiales bacterium]|nr:helix-turn-helix domain-containing protein [Verrucomicrobiales bacterium]
MGFPKGQKRDFNALQRRRLKAATLFDKGLAPAEVARQLGVSCQSASRWHKAWEKGGKSALKQTPKAGRPPRLRPQDLPNTHCADLILNSILTGGVHYTSVLA